MTDINPWDDGPPAKTHVDFAEIYDEAFQDWLQRNPTALKYDEAFQFKRLLHLLVDTNKGKIDGHLEEVTRATRD